MKERMICHERQWPVLYCVILDLGRAVAGRGDAVLNILKPVHNELEFIQAKEHSVFQEHTIDELKQIDQHLWVGAPVEYVIDDGTAICDNFMVIGVSLEEHCQPPPPSTSVDGSFDVSWEVVSCWLVRCPYDPPNGGSWLHARRFRNH
jgi:hypothetical protein